MNPRQTTGQLALLSDRVILPDGERQAVLLVSQGRIIDVLSTLPTGFAGEVWDYSGLAILPGFVDTHVHVNEPGRTDWEGFLSAGHAAAAGGITTIVDMPLNCSPVTISAAALQAKMDTLDGQLSVDCGFWGGAIPESLDHLAELLDSGVLGAKCFLIDSGLAEFPPLSAQQLHQAFSIAARASVPFLVHAEWTSEKIPSNRAMDNYLDFVASRPDHWETEAIGIVIEAVRQTGCHAHIVHLSSAEALSQIRLAKAQGLPLTVETCPHYLLLAAEEVPVGNTLFKCCPPIRSEHNRERLWQAVQAGLIDGIVTDHSPCSPHLKALDTGDLQVAWGGIASLQFGPALIIEEGLRRGLSLLAIARLIAEQPASWAGLGERKGRIAVGWDADFAIWAPDKSFCITEENILFRHKVSPYLGRNVSGRIEATWLRGQCIYQNGGEVRSGWGRPLLRETNHLVKGKV